MTVKSVVDLPGDLDRSRMDESTFEMIDEELGTTLPVSPPKPLRQQRGAEMCPQRRLREVPKSVALETPSSRGLSMQNVAQTEPPWQGVTLNRCLFIAISILVLSSGCQRLHEFLRGRKAGTDGNVIDAGPKHSALKKDHSPAHEMETSLWDTFFSWFEDEKERRRRDKSKRTTQGRETRSLRHKPIPDRKLLKDREGLQKGRRRKTRTDEDETKAQRETVKRPTEKKVEIEKETKREKNTKV